MGEVYEAEHQVLRRRYALKLLPATLDWQGVGLERFQREAQVMANLEHPNILRVDEFGEAGGRYWLRMELAGGVEQGSGVGCQASGKRVVSLQDLADARGGKVPQGELLGILKQVLAGLDYAHAHGAIHRDLKPSNILLFPNPQSPNTPIIKITDFGLVRLVGEEWVRSQARLSVQRSLSIGDEATVGKVESEGTSTRSLLGTYEYMSPEQKRGEEADARSDLYSVGVMTYRLLTGRNIGPKLPSRIDTTLVPAWDALVESALEEDARERSADCQSLQRHLENVATQLDERSKIERAQEQKRARDEAVRQSAELKRLAAEEKQDREEQARRLAEARAKEAAQRQSRQPTKPPKSFTKNRNGWWGGFVLLLVIGGFVVLGLEQRVLKRQTHRTLDLGGGVTLDLVWIPAGIFTMGSPTSESGRDSDEGPQHQVTISSGFWMGKTEVTQAQWGRVMGSNPSNLKGAKNPVEQVTWNEAKEFCGRVGGRLPTEAEWEYACRAGTTGPYAGDLGQMGWYVDNSGSTMHPVGQKDRNAWGLYDMHGNVFEWCEDGKREYSSTAQTDPEGPAGSSRVLRGGSWLYRAGDCRSATRRDDGPGLRGDDSGFRVVVR